MIVGCFAGIPVDNSRLLISIFSLSFSIIFLIFLKNLKVSNKGKILFIYAHLTTLFFPFILFSTNVGCSMACISWCGQSVTGLVLLALPTTLLLSTITSLFVIPSFHLLASKKHLISGSWMNHFLKRHSNIARQPKLFVVDKSEPIAFCFKSFKSAIFLSVGLFDILDIKEIKAVLLHELHHLSRSSPILKSSLRIFSIFSPLSLLYRFHSEYGKDEMEADDFVVNMQKTDRHLLGARRKIDFWNNSSNMY